MGGVPGRSSPDTGEVFKKLEKSNEKFTIFDNFNGIFSIFSKFLKFYRIFRGNLGKNFRNVYLYGVRRGNPEAREVH